MKTTYFMWDLTAVGHWAVISDRQVPCANTRLHSNKKPFIFDQKFLNKIVWFGGKDMSELGCLYFLMLLCHLGERELESSSPRHHFLLMLPV